jgi:hypothetical protein
MKTLLVFSLLSTLSNVAIAGPEDHMYETCYKATTYVPSEIPEEFCFDDLQLDSEKKFLHSEGFTNNLPKNMTVESVMFETEDRVEFVAKANIANVWESGCGEGLSAYLKIKGKSDITAGTQIDPKALSMQVELIHTNDTCHSRPQTSVVLYKLLK